MKNYGLFLFFLLPLFIVQCTSGNPEVDQDDENVVDEPDVVTPDDPQETPLMIYMTINGNDASDGLTPASPILTLNRAQEIIKTKVPGKDRDVEVRIGPGTYTDQTVFWQFYMRANIITFRPLNDDNVRPVFDGGSIPRDGKTYWFRLEGISGPSNLVFHYIQVQNYSSAIIFWGNPERSSNFNSHNRIYGCYFLDIGQNSKGAVQLQNSRYNEIINNHFINIITDNSIGPDPLDCSELHAIYVTHMSHHNQILRNRFENVCGDPIRFRDYSNDNIVNENTLKKVGRRGAYSEWYDEDNECPCWNNEFRNNRVGKSNYPGAFYNVQGGNY